MCRCRGHHRKSTGARYEGTEQVLTLEEGHRQGNRRTSCCEKQEMAWRKQNKHPVRSTA